jgi:hypothetical protein
VRESRRMEGKEEKCIQSFDKNSEGTAPLGGRRRSWEDNIRINLRSV